MREVWQFKSQPIHSCFCLLDTFLTSILIDIDNDHYPHQQNNDINDQLVINMKCTPAPPHWGLRRNNLPPAIAARMLDTCYTQSIAAKYDIHDYTMYNTMMIMITIVAKYSQIFTHIVFWSLKYSKVLLPYRINKFSTNIIKFGYSLLNSFTDSLMNHI